MPVCKQPVATLVLHATAKNIPWPTLYSLDEFLFIQNKLNISLFFMDVKKILGGEAEDFSITKLFRAFALAMTFQNYLVTTN